jgi:hypothetical protein
MAIYPYREMKSSRIPPAGYFIKADILCQVESKNLGGCKFSASPLKSKHPIGLF